MDYKIAGFELKDADVEKGVIAGYASVFGNVDDGLDIIEPGAFTKTLAERGHRVKACYGHDLLKIVGVPLEIREDAKGLYTVTQLTLAGFWGKEVHALASTVTPAGVRALNELSIGYAPVLVTIDPDNGIRRLQELKLYEYSYVPLAMNDEATVESVKGFLDSILSPEDAARFLATITKAGKVLSGKNRSLITEARDALAAVLDASEPDAAKHGAPLAAASGMDDGARAAHLRSLEYLRIRSRVGV